MGALKYRDEHNKVGYMEKPKGSDDYHQVLDFLRGSHLRPSSYLATIDRTPYTITEDTVRSQLQLGDDGGCYNKEWLVQEGTALGKDYIKSVNGCDDLPKIIRLASPRVNGYLVKASSNPLLFFDSPLPGVNTPWDVMRIVSPSASIGFVFLLLLDVALAAAHSQVSILKLTSEDLSRNLKYVVPTGRVKVPAGRYVVPTGKDNVIVNFELTEDQRKRQQEVLASAANYSDSTWDIILARLQANPDLSSTIFGVEFTDDDFAARMVELVNTRRKELAEQRAQERRERPMTPSQLRQYMRTYVKNQGPAVYSTGWTMAQVRKLSPEQLQEEFDKIQRVVAFTRGLKRDGSPMSSASSKKLKTGDDEVNVEAPSHGVPQEEESATPSRNVSREEVAAPPHSQDIPAAQVEVPSQKATIEDVDAPSNLASTAQHTASSLKKVGTKKKRLGRKGVHTSQSTIPIEEGDPEAEHKVCIKYASDADSASDDDTPVNLYAVVDWELLPTGLGSINVFYRLDNSRKYFTSLREILHLVTRADLMTLYGRVMTFYQDKKANGVGLVLWGDLKVLLDSPEVNDGSDVWKNQHTWSIQSWKLYSFSGVHVLETVSGLVLHMFVDKKYPFSVSLIERMLDHQLEIYRGTVGNKLTTAVQLIAFLKKQISDSKRPKVHEWVINLPCYHNKELASPKQTATAEVVPKSVAGLSFPAASSTLQPFHVRVQQDFLMFGSKAMKTNLSFMCSSQDSSRLDVAVKFIFQSSRYVVPTGRVVVPTGRYVVPAGKVIIIVSPGRLNLVPTGRILSPGKVK
ncbi:hypothetical protein Tco_1214462 [Tanacetum coccineum]